MNPYDTFRVSEFCSDAEDAIKEALQKAKRARDLMARTTAGGHVSYPPEARTLSLAITKLEEAYLWLVAGDKLLP